jgi:purine-binding chemotaxis protein CheW
MANNHSDENGQFLRIGLGDETFAIPASIVREILDVGTMTPVPTSNPVVGSLVNVRGRVVPLADLRMRFNIDVIPPTIDSRVVVLELLVEGEALIVGIIADKVFEVSALDSMMEDDVPRVGMRWPPEFVRSIGRRNDEFVMVLDLNRVFNFNEGDELQEAS